MPIKKQSKKQSSDLFTKNIYKQGKQIGYHVVSLVFTLILVLIAITTVFAVIYQPGFIRDIISYSIGGFWAFFLGYFGYRLGQILEEYFSKIRM